MALTQYAAADGFNVAENSLTVLAPQPATPDGVVPSDLEYYANRSVQPVGFENTDLVWSACTTSERNTVLSVLGLSEATPSNDITFMLRQNSDSWLRVNCTAVYKRTDRRTPIGKRGLTVTLMAIEPAS